MKQTVLYRYCQQSEHMLKMSPFGANTSSETLALLVYCIVKHRLLHVLPNVYQTLLQLVHGDLALPAFSFWLEIRQATYVRYNPLRYKFLISALSTVVNTILKIQQKLTMFAKSSVIVYIKLKVSQKLHLR